MMMTGKVLVLGMRLIWLAVMFHVSFADDAQESLDTSDESKKGEELFKNDDGKSELAKGVNESIQGVGEWIKDKASSDRKSLEDTMEESIQGFGNWFKNAAGDAVDTMKKTSEVAKDKTESGLGTMMGMTGGLSDRFSKVREKIGESGEKMKEAIGDAALNAKDEFESAASKISKHAKDATGAMMSMFG